MLAGIVRSILGNGDIQSKGLRVSAAIALRQGLTMKQLMKCCMHETLRYLLDFVVSRKLKRKVSGLEVSNFACDLM